MQSNFQFHYYFIGWCSVLDLVFTVKFNSVHRATYRCRDENACITRAFLSCRDLIGPGQQHNQRTTFHCGADIARSTLIQMYFTQHLTEHSRHKTIHSQFLCLCFINLQSIIVFDKSETYFP